MGCKQDANPLVSPEYSDLQLDHERRPPLDLDRRQFLKLSGAGAGGFLVTGRFKPESLARAPLKTFTLHKKVGETVSICAYCAGGCGILVGREGNKVVSIEGNPDHPINRGALCSKAQSLFQLRTVGDEDNPRRLTKVLYRPPNGSVWEEKSWDWALTEIARRIKTTRDAGFVEKDAGGATVNRTEAIAHLGGTALDNEECYVLGKMVRALGIVYLDHQARI